ncbi:MAG: ABC transporter permease [Clostridia bacterium]|nr:ABC transporter permease [Clostridia bacterium]
MKNNYSKEHIKYLRINRFKSWTIILFQIIILVALFVGWEIGARTGAIDVFFFSSPSRIWDTLKQLHSTGELLTHSWVTLRETLYAFGIATGLGIFMAIILWWSEYLRKILEPYIVTLNSLPKIALGPIIIIWMGVGSKAIITMAVLIVVIVTTLNVLNAFLNTDKNLITTLKSFGANKFQIFIKVVLPASVPDIISTLKVNVGLSWVGAIIGEFVACKSGIGYLLIYGGQVFNLNLVMTSIIVLCVMATLMYFAVALLEKFIRKSRGQ